MINGDYTSRVRNKKIASVFKEAQLIEKYGSGIKRIQEGFIQHGLDKPIFEEFQGRFGVRVFAEKVSEKVSEKTSEKILALINKNAQITIAELASEIGVSSRSVERNIQKLQKNNRLNRIGSDKGGVWKVINN